MITVSELSMKPLQLAPAAGRLPPTRHHAPYYGSYQHKLAGAIILNLDFDCGLQQELAPRTHT